MGLFSGAKAQINGQKAYRAHVAANQLANEGKPREAAEKYRQVRALYESAIAAGHQSLNIRLSYAVLLMRQGELDLAMAQMRDIRLDPEMTEDNWFDLRLNYAVCLWKQGKLDEAIATARRAMQIKKCAALYNAMGMFLVEQADRTGDFSEVEAFNRESMDYDDEDAGILDNVGMMYLARSRHAADPAPDREKAREYLAKAHAIKPRQITTLYHLARLYHEDGDDANAREVLGDAESLYYSGVCAVSEATVEALRREVQ